MANVAVTTLLRPFSTKSDAAAQVRDKAWFERVYGETFDTVYRYAITLVRDESRAEDVASDVFLKAWKARDQFRGDGNLVSWLLSITHNAALTMVRADARHPITDAAILELSPDPDVGPAESLILAADAEQVRAAMLHLTAEQQQVLFLRFFEGHSHEAIAEKLGRQANAVRALQFRALNRLRTLLGETDAC